MTYSDILQDIKKRKQLSYVTEPWNISGKSTENKTAGYTNSEYSYSGTQVKGVGDEKYAPLDSEIEVPTEYNAWSSPTKKDESNPYRGFTVKIVGDDITEKDYWDFHEAFRNENEENDFPKLNATGWKNPYDMFPMIENPKSVYESMLKSKQNGAGENKKNYIGFEDAKTQKTKNKLTVPPARDRVLKHTYYDEVAKEPYKKYVPEDYNRRYGNADPEQVREALDGVSNALAVASLIPVVDTFADIAAVPVDLLRGDWVGAGLDLFGAIPVIGEVGDAAKYGKKGFEAIDAIADTSRIVENAADTIKTADAATDTATALNKGADLIENVSDAGKNFEKLDYNALRIDGTVEDFLRKSDNPIRDMERMSDSIAKTSPVPIPEGATMKPKKTTQEYFHMEYRWDAGDGYEYTCRWHTRNPTAPIEQRDVWVVERRIKGMGYGPNHRQSVHEVLIGDQWITKDEWKNAAIANRLGYATEQQKRWLKNGHFNIQE